jgi:hypothetical protein
MGDNVKRLVEQLINPDVVGLCPRAQMRVSQNQKNLIAELESILNDLINRLYD